MAEQPLVGIIMGSKSDLGVMEDCAKTLESLGVHVRLDSAGIQALTCMCKGAISEV